MQSVLAFNHTSDRDQIHCAEYTGNRKRERKKKKWERNTVMFVYLRGIMHDSNQLKLWHYGGTAGADICLLYEDIP